MSKDPGFTEAEKAAFEWSKRQNRLNRSSSRDHSRRRSRERSRNRKNRDSSDSSSLDLRIRKGFKSYSSSSSRYIGGSNSSKSHKSRSRSNRYRDKRDYYDRKTSQRQSRSSSLRSISSSRSSRRYGRDPPREPFNPLHLAYSKIRRGSRSWKSRNRKHSQGRDSNDKEGSNWNSYVKKGNYKDNYDNGRTNRDKKIPDDEKWKHDLYESDGERASYEADLRKKKIQQNVIKMSQKNKKYSESDSDDEIQPKLITKKGWKSRAGGVYIPGDEDSDEDLYTNYTYSSRHRSRSYERPDPSYTLD